MKTINLAVILIGVFISSLATAQVQASYDYDKEADFSAVKTYKISEDALNYQMNELNRDRIINAIKAQLNAKGLSESDNPDVLINFHIKLGEEQRATENTTYYGAGGRYGYRWGGGFSTSTIDVDTYTVGTVFVDMIDAGKNELIWQGRGSGTYQENISPEKRDKRITKGMAKIFKKYPPKAK